MFRRVSCFLTALMLAGIFLTACGSGEESSAAEGEAASASEDQVVLRFNIDPIGKALVLTEDMVKEYEEQTGVKIELIKGPTDATERLSQYLQFFSARSDDIDVYQVDVIWPGILAEHLIDLKPHVDDTDDFFQAIIENNTVDGKLVALPWFADAGVLYYRTDLLSAYGYDGPPETWDELEEMSKSAMEVEHAKGNKNFWGFVWQGQAYECLTCDAIEWQDSFGGGRIVDSDGNVTINNPKAIEAFTRAKGWVGTISPPGVMTYREEESRQLFQTGNAMFMRNWPYAYALGNGDDSEIKGKFEITVLPSGGAKHAAALGGWQLAVSKYSKHQDEAIKFVRWMTGPEAQKRRAMEAGMLATRVALYDDPEIQAEIPYFKDMKSVFQNATPRPSTVTGPDYNEVSTIYFQNVSRILSGQVTPEEGVQEIQEELEDLLN
ncbi:ABC transporter substrate-binding protein [bacterium]|nr:ABC transporter substrate-binding protein [bacterium]